jgi:malonate transporter
METATVDTTLEIVPPIFGVILAGYLFARTPLLSQEGIRGLSGFVFYVAMPALLFRTLGRGVVPAGTNLDIFLTYLVGCLVLYGIALGIGRLVYRGGLQAGAILGMGATFSNAVMLGIPLVFTAFGEEGLVAIMMIVVFQSAVLMPLTTILLEVGRGDGTGLSRLGPTTLAALARNPVIVAMVAGLAWGTGGLSLPGPVDRFIDLLGHGAVPAALFALGASMAAFRITGDLMGSLVMVGLKMLALPVIIWVLAAHVFALPPLHTAVAVIAAALPVGANVFIIASAYRVHEGRAATAVVISTAISVVTAALLLAHYAPDS